MPIPFNAFSIARLPRIEFGPGVVRRLPEIASRFGDKVLFLTSNRSSACTGSWNEITREFGERGISLIHVVREGGEPTAGEVDRKVEAYRDRGVTVVIAMGGGSVIDEGKAIAGLLNTGHSVMDYLEGVGPELPYEGPSVPFIAVPTTAGTGSEATKNAVLSGETSESGPFKKSFRDEQLVPEWALVDPDLIATCPPEILAGNGMDAFTQLLESFVSTRANPLNDALARRGMALVRDGLPRLYDSGGQDEAARGKMALASLLSGINLAQTGLGSVHGLAAPLGAYHHIPHGLVCGTLVGAATQVNIEALQARGPANGDALEKYADAGRLLVGIDGLSRDEALQALVQHLSNWTLKLDLPGLGSYGVRENEPEFQLVVANARGSSMKTNPIELTDAEIARVLQMRL